MSRRALWLLALVGLAATALVYILWLDPLERLLQARGHGIVPFELAFTPARAEAIMTAWGSAGMEHARLQVQRDFAFIPSYAAVLWAGLRLAAGIGEAGEARGRIQGWARRLALAVPVAAGLDVLENLALLRLLAGSGSPLLAPLAGVAAAVKFGIILVAVGVLVVALSRVRARRIGQMSSA